MPLQLIQGVQAFIDSGDQVLRALVTQCGRTTPPATIFVADLTQDRTVTSLAVGPQSDTDQVTIRYAIGAPLVNTVSVSNFQLKQTTVLSIGYPLDFGLRAPIDLQIILDPSQFNAKQPGYLVDYTPDGSVVPEVFTDPPVAEAFLFEPVLELLIGFDGRKIGVPGHTRHAKRFVENSPVTLAIGSSWRMFLPVFGRRHVRALVKQFGAPAAFDVDIGYVSFFRNGLPLLTTMAEKIISPVLALAADGANDRFVDSPHAREDWMVVRVTRTGGAVGFVRCEATVAD